MVKNGVTKKKILDMIASGNKNLSEISEKLNLAPSTVSQHLQELKNMGAIQEVENEHIKKWKYYRLNPGFDNESMDFRDGTLRENIKSHMLRYTVAAAAVAVLVVLIFSYSGYCHCIGALGGNIQSSSLVQVGLTDPPIVPYGTQALYINYSSVSLHVFNNGSSSSEWIQSNASGTVDLMSLVNVSQIIAGVEVTHNSKIDLVRFNITSARILINGTYYNVLVPSGEITTKVLNNDKDVNATSEVLVDLYPTVISMYVNGSKQFVMIPQSEAIAESNHAGTIHPTSPQIGTRAKLNQYEMQSFYGEQSNLTITSASLGSGNNGSTTISVTIENTAKDNVTLNNLLLLGGQQYPNSSENMSGPMPQPYGHVHQISFMQNSAPPQNGGLMHKIEYARGILFSIDSNGSMEMLTGIGMGMYQNQGYVLGAGRSVTLNFQGQLTLRSDFDISPVSGANYSIVILGKYGRFTVKNVTAT